MKDEIFSSLQKASLKIFPEFTGNFQVTKPQDSLHGDWSSNIALIMAKEMKKNPRELAVEIISALEGLDYSEKIEVAGAGFINIYQNKLPIYEILSGASIAIAAVLLITPGFFTDTMGFLLLIPITRKLLLYPIINKSKNQTKEDKTIEAEIIDEKKDEL